VNHDDFEERLRETLDTHAAQAPESVRVERRVLDDVLVDRTHRTARWRTWGVPLAAAAAVAAVAATLVGVQHYRPSASRHVTPPAGSISAAPTQPAASPSSLSSQTTVANAVGVTNFKVDDITWAGPDLGWALGRADCPNSSGSCIAMVHTTDGKSWHVVTNPLGSQVDVAGCDARCVTNIRFATPQVGYAFSQSILYMTDDGGATWHLQDGGAYALETLDNNVIRLVADHSGCPGPCNLRVQLSDIGSRAWTTVMLPGSPIQTGTVQLVRAGSSAFISTFDGHAGSDVARPMYVSTDDGRTWTQRADPCVALGDRFVTVNIMTAADGSLSVVCWNQLRSVIRTSTDDGRTFTPAQAEFDVAVVVAAASATTFVGDTGTAYVVSTNRGASWQTVIRDSSSGTPSCGFESSTIGRCISHDGSTIWTTRDAGAHWSAVTFPS